MRKRTLRSVGAAVALGALLLAGCSATTPEPGNTNGGDGPAVAPETAADVRPGYFGDNEGSGEPVEGGTFTFAYSGSILSFDPATQQYAGTSGGNEAAAVYGILAEYNSEAGAYEPAMAETLEANDDFTTWTIGLRDGVTFTDGTPYDAEAVKFNMDRLAASGQGWSALWNQMVTGVTAVDATTVEVTLSSGWADFGFLLSQAPGMIASPAAIEESGEDYLNNPVGAGPFVLDRWTPGSTLQVTANEDYWDGKPYLDSIIFQTVTGGDQAAADAFSSGGAQGVYSGTLPIAIGFLDPADELNGYARVVSTASVLLMNSGTPGKPDAPTTDLNVRKAVAQAIDTAVVDARTNDGLGIPSSGLTMFDAPSMWANDAAKLPFDLEAAQASLELAKADGFDGVIDLLYTQSAEASALTVSALLEAAGFEVTTSPMASTGDMINAVLIEKNYDLAMYGWPTPDEPGELFTNLLGRIGVQGNPTGFFSEALQQSLTDFAATADETEKRAALTRVQEEFTAGAPAVPLSGGIGVAAWAPNAHGITVSSRMTLDFSKAWLAE